MTHERISRHCAPLCWKSPKQPTRAAINLQEHTKHDSVISLLENGPKKVQENRIQLEWTQKTSQDNVSDGE